jgi:hypothetical protein
MNGKNEKIKAKKSEKYIVEKHKCLKSRVR